MAKLPRHVAIIMDGNGRWAKKRFLPRFAGHQKGIESVRAVIKSCVKHNIEVLTLFAFSSENWRRPKEEVNALMKLFIKALQNEVSELHENNIRLCFIGARDGFSEQLQILIDNAEKLTVHNTGLNLVIAANYGGRWDIAQAAKKLAEQVQMGKLQLEEIDEEKLSHVLSLSDLPAPDLFIRTGGEQRISNFLLWQLAYAEMYFSDVLWPDFNEKIFEEALTSFAKRQRRFGLTGDQVEKETT